MVKQIKQFLRLQLMQLTFLLIIFPKNIYAETCISIFEVDTAMANSIFVGKLVDKMDNKFWFNRSPSSIYTFEIFESYKGLASYMSFISLLDLDMNYSNNKFKIDSTYLIFAYSNCGKSHLLYTRSCSMTGLLSENKNLLARLKPPLIHSKRNLPKNYFNKDQLQIDSLTNSNKLLNTQLNKISTTNKKLENSLLICCLIILITGAWSIKIYLKGKQHK